MVLRMQAASGKMAPAVGARELSMKKFLALIAVLASVAWPAKAALDVGTRAPDFTAAAALAGKPFSFSLAASLAMGPVVLYFFPAAFTTGCSIEAHEFAEATPQFEALGARVVGVSTDDIETLTRFSLQACQGKFAVASDAGKGVVKAYGASMAARPDFANRVSYVIAPNGSVVYSYVSLDPSKHVENTLAAVRQWQQANGRK